MLLEDCQFRDDIYTMPMNGALVQKKNYTIVNNNDTTAAQKKDSTAHR